MLGLAVPVRVALIRGLAGVPDGEERQQCGDEVRAGVHGFGDESEATARQPGSELHGDQDDRGGDGDERGSPLR